MMLRGLCLVIVLFGAVVVHAEQDESWLYGKWQLTYDPDGAQKDWLEFLPDGDAVSSGPHGSFEGLYIVDGDAVKAVFTFKDKEFIMHFKADRQARELRIITSKTGRASVYSKVSDN